MTRPRPRLVLVMLAAVLALAGCSTTVEGTGRPAVYRPSQVTTASQLHTLLIPVPDGAEPSEGEWAANTTPTIDEFAATVYRGGNAASYLEGLGVRAVAHRAWVTPDGGGGDMYLLLVDPSRKPVEWYLSEADGAKAQGLTPVSSNAAPAVGFTFPDRTEDDLRVTRYFSYRGNVAIMLEHFDPGRGLDDPDLPDSWLRAQYGRLA